MLTLLLFVTIISLLLSCVFITDYFIILTLFVFSLFLFVADIYCICRLTYCKSIPEQIKAHEYAMKETKNIFIYDREIEEIKQLKIKLSKESTYKFLVYFGR